MTISKLDTLAATHYLWNFEVSSGRSHDVVFRRKINDIITIMMRVDDETADILTTGMYVHTDSTKDPEWYELTEEQFDELALFIN